MHIADHLERGRADPGEEGDDVIEQPDLRLVEKRPEIADDRRRQHHRDQDDRRPQPMAAEFAVDQIGEREAEQRLDSDRRQHEACRHLHGLPDVRVAEQVGIMLEAQPPHRCIRPIRPIIRERQPNGPDQREDVDRQQQHDGRRDEQPGDRAVGQPADTIRDRLPGHAGCSLNQGACGTRFQHSAHSGGLC